MLHLIFLSDKVEILTYDSGIKAQGRDPSWSYKFWGSQHMLSIWNHKIDEDHQGREYRQREREREKSFETEMWSTLSLRHDVEGKKPAKEIEKGAITGIGGNPGDTVLEAKLRKYFKKEWGIKFIKCCWQSNGPLNLAVKCHWWPWHEVPGPKDCLVWIQKTQRKI